MIKTPNIVGSGRSFDRVTHYIKKCVLRQKTGMLSYIVSNKFMSSRLAVKRKSYDHRHRESQSNEVLAFAEIYIYTGSIFFVISTDAFLLTPHLPLLCHSIYIHGSRLDSRGGGFKTFLILKGLRKDEVVLRVRRRKQCCWNVTQLLSKIVFAMGGGDLVNLTQICRIPFHTSITKKINKHGLVCVCVCMRTEMKKVGAEMDSETQEGSVNRAPMSAIE